MVTKTLECRVCVCLEAWRSKTGGPILLWPQNKLKQMDKGNDITQFIETTPGRFSFALAASSRGNLVSLLHLVVSVLVYDRLQMDTCLLLHYRVPSGFNET